MTSVLGSVAFIESSYTGAGLDCIAAVRARQLRPVLLSRDASVYNFIEGSGVTVVECDTENVDRVRDCLLGIDRLTAVGTTDEYSVFTAARVSRLLGLPGQEPEAARACRDKHVMRQTLNPELSPAWTAVESITSLDEAGLRFPLVVKPANLTGSALVRLCLTRREAEAHVVHIRAQAATPSTPLTTAILAEEFIDGPEFSVEFMDGRLLGVTVKHLFEGDGFVEAGHDFPLPASAAAFEDVRIAAASALRQLGADWGPVHMELRWTRGGAKVVEVNGRLSGDRIPRLIALATGYSMSEGYVGRMLGDEPLKSSPDIVQGAAIRMWRATEVAKLRRVVGLAEVKASPGVAAVEFHGVEGRHYVPHHSNLDRLGYVIAVGADAESAGSSADSAASRLRLLWDVSA